MKKPKSVNKVIKELLKIPEEQLKVMTLTIYAILMEKKMITQEEWVEYKKEVEKEIIKTWKSNKKIMKQIETLCSISTNLKRIAKLESLSKTK